MTNNNIPKVIVSSNEWSIETIVDLLISKNIQVNPTIRPEQHWDITKKSRFIESILLGFPLPQILLAADLEKRGKHIIVDGNQRLLSILEFYGESDTKDNAFTLTELEFRTDLNGFTHASSEAQISFNFINNRLATQVMRVTRIQNWQNQNLLNNIYSRLN